LGIWVFIQNDMREALTCSHIEMQKDTKELNKGFSLIESLISLSLFLIIVLSSLEYFAYTRSHFQKLKDEQETNQSAYAALDKMRIDLLHGGSGLLIAAQLGVLDCIFENNGSFIIYAKDRELPLFNDLISGQTRILQKSTKKIKKGAKLCIFDANKGEVRSIASVHKGSLVLSSPLNFSYQKETTCVILLEKISLYLDEAKQILRRKVNNSPSQPLCENVISFDFDYEKSSNLASLRVGLEYKNKLNKERVYEISVFPKNMALASRP